MSFLQTSPNKTGVSRFPSILIPHPQRARRVFCLLLGAIACVILPAFINENIKKPAKPRSVAAVFNSRFHDCVSVVDVSRLGALRLSVNAGLRSFSERSVSADDASAAQPTEAHVFLRPERALCPERPQHFRKVRGAIGPPVGGRLANGRRLTLLARDYRRLWQRRRGRRARCQGEREGN